MSRSYDCPKCGADISDSWQEAEWDVGINAGWFCDACDLGVGDEGGYEPMEGDVPIKSYKELYGDRPLGTPLSALSSQPGDPKNLSDPRHAGYAEFCRIARSWGYD
jgi:hypothetical protein